MRKLENARQTRFAGRFCCLEFVHRAWLRPVDHPFNRVGIAPRYHKVAARGAMPTRLNVCYVCCSAILIDITTPLPDTEPIDELRRQYHELASLAGSLAHEIKNPLSVIRMNMELLHEDFEGLTSIEARRAMPKIETVNRQCERLQIMLNDFLRFTKLSRLELTVGSLNDQVKQVLNFYEPQATKQNVTMQRYLDPDLPSINLEPQTLHAALVNLVKNALEAMPDGGELLARTRITRTGVALDLIDTGCGMEGNTLIKMFEQFYTTKDDGTGLGLPTAKKIIEAHGGVIHVQSAVGRGTQFTVEFPTPKRI